MKRLSTLTFIIFLAIIFPWESIAQSLDHKTNLKPKDIQNEQSLGYKIATNNLIERAAISAPKDNKGAVRSGAVYIFDALKEKQIAKIKSPEARLNAAFGFDLSFSHQNLLIGAPGLKSFSKAEGRAYVYQQENGPTEKWQLLCLLSPSESQAKDLFGYSVKLHNDIAIVGAPGLNRDNGAVFVFKQDDLHPTKWYQIAKLTSTLEHTKFGYSIDFDGKTLAIGAPAEKGGYGAVYLYKIHNKGKEWQLIKEIKSNDNKVYLGSKLLINGETLAVVAKDYVSQKVYMYNQNHKGNNNWGLSQKLEPRTPRNIYDFGNDIQLYNNYLLVGAPSYGNYHGAMYLYKQLDDKSWKKVYDTEYSLNAKYKSRVGTAVAIYDKNTVLAGCIEDMYRTGYLAIFDTKLTADDESQQTSVSNDNNTTININVQVDQPNSSGSTNTGSNQVEEPSNTGIKPVKPTRVLLMDEQKHLGNLQEGESYNNVLLLKNSGNKVLKITNIGHSSNIIINNKQFSIAPNDSYKVNYTYTQDSRKDGYIEVVSNKTSGNNYMRITSEVMAKPIYALKTSCNEHLSLMTLGSKKKIKLLLENKGNQPLDIVNIKPSKGIHLPNSRITLNIGEARIIEAELLNYKTGQNMSTVEFSCSQLPSNNILEVSSEVVLGTDDFMMNSLIIAPDIMDERLIINMKYAKGKDVVIKLSTFMGKDINSYYLKNDGNNYHFIPTSHLKDGAYKVEAYDKETNRSISSSIFHIM